MKRNRIVCFIFILCISIFSGAYVKEADAATHVHTDDCYNGTVHIHTGSSSAGGGCYGTYHSGSVCGASLVYVSTQTSQLSFGCTSCGVGTCKGSYTFDVYRCGYGHSVSVIKVWYWTCDHCGLSYNRPASSALTSCPTTTAGYYSLNCGMTAGSYYNNGVLVIPTCEQVVTEITPASSNQTVYYGESMDCLCNAIYLDGHSSTISCSASGFDSTMLGGQVVTLTFSGFVGSAKTSGTLSTQSSVTVVDYVSDLHAVSASQTIYYGGAIDNTAEFVLASGDTGIAACNVSGFSSTTVGAQTVTLTLEGMTADTGVYPTCSITVTVLPGLVSIEPVSNSQTIYKGDIPAFTVTAFYMDGSSKTVIPDNDFDPTAFGLQTVTLTFSDQGISKTTTCEIIVRPNLTGLSVTASESIVLYDTDITFSCMAFYEDGTNRLVTAMCITPYQKKVLGDQLIEFSYKENGVNKESGIHVQVLDYPVSLDVELEKLQIYQTQSISIQSADVTMASGAVETVITEISPYDNITVGNEEIIFSYTLNDVCVTKDITIMIMADLYDLSISSESLIIYRGQDLGLTVVARTNISGDVVLEASEYTVIGLDNNVYDREGKYYTVSYTDKDITITKDIYIVVLPNITGVEATFQPQTTEGVQIPFAAIITYEDGSTISLTDSDLDNDIDLSLQNYDIDQVGYQDVILQYTEGDVTVIQEAYIRVRAIIRVSIPVTALISIDPNAGEAYSAVLSIDNQSKESIMIGISSVDNESGSMKDVLPDAHTDWSLLGKADSKDIAIGITYSDDEWMRKDLLKPLYFVEADNALIGVIDKESVSTLSFMIYHGNAFENSIDFQYVINWTIRLAED